MLRTRVSGTPGNKAVQEVRIPFYRLADGVDGIVLLAPQGPKPKLHFLDIK